MQSKEGLFNIIDKHLLEDENPSVFLNKELKNGDFDLYPLTLMSALKKTVQSPVHHPEGDVWIHTMLVVDGAAKVRDEASDKRAFMWAAFLHDIGKAVTTKEKKGRITAYDHDKMGEALAEEFLRCFDLDEIFINKVIKLVRWHMQPLFASKHPEFLELHDLVEETNPEDIGKLSMCDRLGRGNFGKEKREAEIQGVNDFLNIVKEYKENK